MCIVRFVQRQTGGLVQKELENCLITQTSLRSLDNKSDSFLCFILTLTA